MYWVKTDEDLTEEQMQEAVNAMSEALGTSDVILTIDDFDFMTKGERREYVEELVEALEVDNETEEKDPILGHTQI